MGKKPKSKKQQLLDKKKRIKKRKKDNKGKSIIIPIPSPKLEKQECPDFTIFQSNEYFNTDLIIRK